MSHLFLALCNSTWELEPIFDVSTLVQCVRRAVESPSATPKPTEFRFELLTEAAAHNWSVLKKYDRSLSRALEAQGGSPLQPGSEFRDLSLLEPILGRRHPLWPRFRSILDSGSDWALDPVSDESRLDSVIKNIGRGNHKSARDRPEVLKDQVLDDVTRGFALPLPAKVAPLIPGAEVAPMGLAAQSTIDQRGWRDHAQGPPDSRPILRDQCRTVRQQQSTHGGPPAASGVRPCPPASDPLHRRRFGGRPCSSEWCNMSESAADLARALLQCSDWDPSELHSPQQKHLGRPKVEGDDVPFAPALDMIVTLPDNKDGIVEPCIDDLIAAAPDLGDNKDRTSAATLLAIHALGRPVSDSEPLPRDDLASIKKLLAEGTPSEALCLLGWDADTRRLLLRLPWSKHLACRDDMLRLLRARGATRSELDALVGRLNHVGCIIPAARHFLSRLRDRLWKARRHGRQRFDSEDAEDLNPWLRFLRRAADGMSMNLLTCRCPTHEHISDACEHGIGGWSSSGRAWRFALPEEPWGRFTLNCLEFLAAVIGPWIDHIEGNLPTLSCVLSGTDSTTAEGWLRKSNFVSHGEKDADVAVKLATARKLADMLIETNTMLHSQWFQGKRNPEADSLSRDADLSDADLTKLLLSSPECQLPSNFRIAPLPNEIASWIVSQARTLPVRKQLLQRPLPRSTLSRGAAGLSSCSSSGPGTTSSSTRCHPETEQQSFSAPLPPRRPTGQLFGAKVFATGCCVDSPRHRLTCMLVLPAQPAQGPRERRHRPAFIPSTAAVPRTQPVRPGRAAAGEGDHLPAPPRDRLSVRETEEDRAVGQLAVGAFFCAMRSCEYSRVSGERRTKLLRLRNNIQLVLRFGGVGSSSSAA